MHGEYHPYVWLGSCDGAPYDRINYSLTHVPPLIISPTVVGPDQVSGYFHFDSKLVAGAR